MDTVLRNYKKQLPAAYYSTENDLPTRQLKVNATLVYCKVVAIDQAQQSATMLLDFVFKWTDPRLRWMPSDYGGLKTIPMSRDVIWQPDTIPFDTISFRDILPDDQKYLDVWYNGQVSYYETTAIEFVCHLKMNKFPFDTQICELQLTSYSFPQNDLMVSGFININDENKKDSGNGEWSVLNMSVYDSVTMSSYGELFSAPAFQFTMKRSTTYYVLMMIIPSFILTFLCVLGLFWEMADSNYLQNLNLGYAAVLAMLFVLQMVTQDMPKISSSNKLSTYLIANLAIITVASIVVMLMAKFSKIMDIDKTKGLESIKDIFQKRPNLILMMLFSAAVVTNFVVLVGWCVDDSSCHFLTDPGCKTYIKNSLNCPTAPQSGYEYTDDFGRNIAMPIIVAAGTADPLSPPGPEECLKNSIPTAKVSQKIHAKCSEYGPANNTCHVFTAYDTTKKAIIISFRGTDTPLQLYQEIESEFKKKEPFFDNGFIFKYFSDAYNMLWQQGLEASVRNLKYLYPTYEVWVMGHSLGGALASVCASYLVKLGLADGATTRLVTFGQPRTGDKAYAQWHDENFLYSYRVVHHMDIVPHIPPDEGKDEPWHHRYEIWYNNDMGKNDTWTLCPEEDGKYCSNLQKDLSIHDHLTYFVQDKYKWAKDGCHLDQL